MSSSVISQRIQDSFVYLSITNTDFLKLSRHVVKASYFSSEVTEDIVSTCYSYFDQFDEAPLNHLHDEMVRFLGNKDPEDTERYYDYLLRVQDMDEPNQAYIIKRINDFIKAREFEEAAVTFVKKVERGEFTEAKELMQKALKVGIEREEVGLKYFEMSGPPAYYKSMKEILVPTGFPLIDERIRGYRRAQFVVLLGGFKAGKSWSCTHLGNQGLLYGRKVLHISHEATLDEVEMRYDMALGGFTSEKTEQNIEFTDIDINGITQRIWSQRVGSVYNYDGIKGLRKKMSKLGGELIIKKYPMGTCTMEEIERYMDYLETYEGFIPDILINDYVEKMQLPMGDSAALRDRIDRAYILHKKIADERNILVYTVSQVTRGALGKLKLTQADCAEDIRKIGNVDIALGISQTADQARDNHMSVVVLAARSGPQGFGCIVSRNLAIGQMCTNSWDFPSTEEEKEYQG